MAVRPSRARARRRLGAAPAIPRDCGCARRRSSSARRSVEQTASKPARPARCDRLVELEAAVPDHLERDVEDDGEADIGDPAVPLQQARDEAWRRCPSARSRGRGRRQHDRVLERRAGHREHVVERHGDVGDDDLPGGLRKGLSRRAAGDVAVRVEVAAGERLLRGVLLRRAECAARATSSSTPRGEAGRRPTSRPTIASSRTWSMLAKTMRSTVAATMPTRIALFRCSRGRPAAARPMTMALSPASTRSIMMTWRRAVRASGGKELVHAAPCVTSGVWPPPSVLRRIEVEERLGHGVVVQSDITALGQLSEGPGLVPAL